MTLIPQQICVKVVLQMSDAPVSIIIPVLNEEKNLEKLLPVIEKRQSGYVKEVIISDAGSSDLSVEIARAKGSKVIMCNHKNRGFQMNSGAASAKGEILYFLHADTIPPYGFDKKIVSEIKKGAIAGCFRLEFDGKSESKLLEIYGWFTRFRTTLFRFGDQSLFVRSDHFWDMNGFDTSLIVMEDQNIVRKLKKTGPFRLLDDNVVTSSQKYRRVGIIKLQIIFVCILSGYYLGVSQETLVHFYRSMLQNQKI